jgi:hypothetical protein
MSNTNPQDQLHPAERAYLSPARPNLIDLVPEFAALPKKEQLRVTKAASKRVGWRDRLTGMSLVLHISLFLFVVLALGMQAILIGSANLAIRFPPLVQSIRTLDRAYNALAAKNPGYVAIHLDLSLLEKAAGSLLWFKANPLWTTLVMLLAFAFFAYFWQALATRIEMYLLLPHVRAVLREQATGKSAGSK